jgi:ribonucleoside-diphosphate reductase alpha chain
MERELLNYFDNDPLRVDVFIKKYALKDERGDIVEKTPMEFFRRIAKAIASVEKDKEHWEEKFYYILKDFKFVPAGRILFGAGNNYIPKNTLLNCYVIPIKEDSIEGIYDCAKEMARTYSWGGGVGTDISILRPTNSPVLNSARFSTGAVSFMHLFSLTTGLIGQEGRRGALMITIDVSHPDVELFIYAKSKPDFFTLEVIKQNSYKYNEEQLKIIEDILTRQQVKFANISVKIRDEFMKAVLNNDDWELWYPDIVRNPKISESEIEEMLNNNCAITFERILSPYDVNLYKNEYMLFEAKNGEIEYKGRRFELRKKRVYKVVKARELWDKIVKSAWESAEPGLIFWDTIIKNHNAQYFQPVLSTNPCSEKPLPAYGNCDLGSLNLTKFVKNNDWNYELLKEVIPIAVRFLDNVIDVSKYPLKEQEISSKSARRLGLGILGLADALAMMKIRYDSDEALEKVESLMRFIRDESYRASVNLAKEKGAFEKFDFEKWSNSEFVKRLPKDILEDVKKYGIRNVEILSIAPTGSISILAGNVSSGIEPIFSLKYIRYSLGNFYYVYHPLVKKYLNKNDDEITDEDLKKLPDYFRTAHEINWEYRVKLQGLIQKYVDSAISSTINLPNDIDVETVKKLYFISWKEGCKGITIYREGSREGVLISEKKEEKKKESSLKPIKKERPFAVSGVTYKIKYKGRKWYVTVNGDEKGMPIEIFAHSSDMVGLEWSTALSMMISAVLRKLSENDDPKFIVENLFKVKEIQGQGYVYKGFYMPSEPAVLGLALKLFIEGVRNGNLEAKGEIATPTLTFIDEKGNIKPKLEMEVLKDTEICPNCSNRTLLKGEKAKELADCSTFCLSCGFSKCD